MNMKMMTISELKRSEALRLEREEIEKKALAIKLVDDEEKLIEFSNMINEEYTHLLDFEKANNYLTIAIQRKMGETAGYADEPGIIDTTLRILGVK